MLDYLITQFAYLWDARELKELLEFILAGSDWEDAYVVILENDLAKKLYEKTDFNV